jgi:PST family polysaccharide transporter
MPTFDALADPLEGLPLLGIQIDAGAAAPPERGDASRALITASTLTLIASTTGMVIGLLRSKLVAVLLGPGGVGILANLAIYNTFIGSAGTAFAGQGATRAIAAARAEGRDDRVDWLIRYSFLMPPAVGLLILVGTVAFAPQISSLVMGDSQYAHLIALSAIAVPLTLLAASYAGVLQGFIRIGSLAKANIATTVVSLVVTVALIVGFGMTGAVVALSVVAALQVGIFFMREPWVVRDRSWRRRLEFNWPALHPVLQLGLASVVVTIAGTLVTLLIRSDIVRVLGLDQNGIYQPVASISDTYLEILISSTSFYLFPKLTELLMSGRRSEAAAEVGQGLRVLLAVTVPLLLVVMAFGQSIVVLLYSSRFNQAADPLSIQMAGSVIKVIAWSAGAALLPLGYYRAWLFICLANLGIKYVGTHLLLPTMGLDGVAVAYNLSWLWSCLAEGFIVIFIARVGPSLRDWRLAAIAVALVLGTFGAHEISLGLGMAIAVAATAAWIVVSRSDIANLARTLNAIARPRLQALRRRRG